MRALRPFGNAPDRPRIHRQDLFVQSVLDRELQQELDCIAHVRGQVVPDDVSSGLQVLEGADPRPALIERDLDRIVPASGQGQPDGQIDASRTGGQVNGLGTQALVQADVLDDLTGGAGIEVQALRPDLESGSAPGVKALAAPDQVVTVPELPRQGLSGIGWFGEVRSGAGQGFDHLHGNLAGLATE